MADAGLGGRNVESWGKVIVPTWKSRGAVLPYGDAGLIGLSLSRQGRNMPPYAELEPKPLLTVQPLRARLLGHHLRC